MNAWNKCVSCGQANLLLREGLRNHVRMASREIGFEYLRFHGTLSDDMRLAIADKSGEIHYNFQLVDEVYDLILDAGMKPIVELSFMPKALASGEMTIFTWKCNVTLPKSWKAWEDLLVALVGHWVERYGLDELKSWFFEVWNEPNLRNFFDGSQSDYFELYRHSAAAVKKVSPELKVGGPSTARSEWVEDFLAFCAQENVPLDFVSTHAYANDDAFFTDSDMSYQGKYKGDDYLPSLARRVHAAVRGSAFPSVPIFWTEWNSCWPPCAPSRESAAQAAFVVKTLAAVEPHVDGYAYWVLSDVYEEGFYPSSAFQGLYGLVNQNGLRKPAYFAYQALSMLGDHEPLTLDGADPSLGALRSVGKEQFLVHCFDGWDKPEGRPSLSVSLPTSGRGFALYQIDSRKNNILKAWRELGGPACPTPEQLRRLAAGNVFQATGRAEAKNGVLTFEVEPGGVVLAVAE